MTSDPERAVEGPPDAPAHTTEAATLPGARRAKAPFLLLLILLLGAVSGWFGPSLLAWVRWRREPTAANEARLYEAVRPRAALVRPWLEERVRARSDRHHFLQTTLRRLRRPGPAGDREGKPDDAAGALRTTLLALPDDELRILVIDLLRDAPPLARNEALALLEARPAIMPEMRPELHTFLAAHGLERHGDGMVLSTLLRLDPHPGTIALALDWIRGKDHAKACAGIEAFRASREQLDAAARGRFWSAVIDAVAAEANDRCALALLEKLDVYLQADPPEALLALLRSRHDKAKGQSREGFEMLIRLAGND